MFEAKSKAHTILVRFALERADGQGRTSGLTFSEAFTALKFALTLNCMSDKNNSLKTLLTAHKKNNPNGRMPPRKNTIIFYMG